MKHALHAEWTKLRTTRDAAWLLLTAIAVTAGLSAITAAAVHPSNSADPVKASLTGIDLGQAVVAVLAVLVIGGEYRTGMIRTTLTAMPRRLTMLAAKATVLTAVVLGAGTVAVLTSVLAGRPLLSGNGFAAFSLSAGSTLRATGGSVLYLALIALFSLGIALVVRDAATATGVVLSLLYLFPIIAAAVSDAHWWRHLQQIGPMPAGLAIQVTTDPRRLPISPWAGLGVLAAWAGGALIIGALMLRLRDA